MSNLPKLLPAIKAYESSPLQIRLDMYDGFEDPGVAFEVFFNKVKRYEVPGVYDSGLNRVTADFTAEQIKEMPLIADVRIRFGADKYPFRVQIKPSSEGSSDGVVGYTIQQAGDSYTVIEIYAKDEIDAQVVVATDQAQIATTKASEAAGSAITAASSANTASTAATTATNQAAAATTKASEAITARNQAVAAQAAAEAARDEAQTTLATKMDFFRTATFASMQAYIAANNPNECAFLVLADENYGDLPRVHFYTKLMGSPFIQLVSYT